MPTKSLKKENVKWNDFNLLIDEKANLLCKVETNNVVDCVSSLPSDQQNIIAAKNINTH